MAISVHQSFIKNNQLHYNSLYPWRIRSSAEERVKRHSFYFGFISSAFSLSYHLMTLNIKFAVKQALKSFLHKSLMGGLFFYSNEVIVGWLSERKIEKGKTQQFTPCWQAYFISSIVLFPIFLATNRIFNLSSKKTLIKTATESLLLIAFGLQFDRNIRQKRNTLINGSIEEKKALIVLL